MKTTSGSSPQVGPIVARIRELTGSQVGRVHPLGIGHYVLGRGSECSIMMNEPDVSRRHAEIEVTADELIITDLGSKNGIHYGEQRVLGEIAVTHGTQFRIGKLVLEVLHPGSKVRQALRKAGEFTSTRVTLTELDTRVTSRAGLKWPLIATVGFLSIAIWLALGR